MKKGHHMQDRERKRLALMRGAKTRANGKLAAGGGERKYEKRRPITLAPTPWDKKPDGESAP